MNTNLQSKQATVSTIAKNASKRFNKQMRANHKVMGNLMRQAWSAFKGGYHLTQHAAQDAAKNIINGSENTL